MMMELLQVGQTQAMPFFWIVIMSSVLPTMLCQGFSWCDAQALPLIDTTTHVQLHLCVHLSLVHVRLARPPTHRRALPHQPSLTRRPYRRRPYRRRLTCHKSLVPAKSLG